MGGERRGRVAKVDIWSCHNLLTQVVTSLVGGIKTHAEAVGACQGEVVDQCAAGAAQSGSVAHDTLGVVAYGDAVLHCLLVNFATKIVNNIKKQMIYYK